MQCSGKTRYRLASSGSLATLMAIRRALSRVSRLAADVARERAGKRSLNFAAAASGNRFGQFRLLPRKSLFLGTETTCSETGSK